MPTLAPSSTRDGPCSLARLFLRRHNSLILKPNLIGSLGDFTQSFSTDLPEKQILFGNQGKTTNFIFPHGGELQNFIWKSLEKQIFYFESLQTNQ